MKKKIILIMILVNICFAIFAGGIDAKSNLNVGYTRNASRNTEHKRPEASLYNIAGTAFMDDGLFLELGNQFVYKEYSNESVASSTKYKDTKPVFLYPNFELVYKSGNIALSDAFAVAGGGGSLNYKKGTALTSAILGGLEHSLDITSITFGNTVSASYKYMDMLSFAAGLRVLYTTQSMSLNSTNEMFVARNGGDEVSYNANGWGVGGIFGVHFQPLKMFDFTAQYKTISKMSCDVKDVKGNMAARLLQTKFDNDLPAELNLGAGCKLGGTYLSASFNYYFNENANIGNALSANNTDYDNTWEIAAGVDHQLTLGLLISCGVMYSNNGQKTSANSVFSPVLDSITFTAGGEVNITDMLTCTFGLLGTAYIDEKYTDSATSIEMNLEKTVINACVSVSCKL